MSNEKNNQNLIVSVAVVAGILGTLSAFMSSNRKMQGWKEQAKNVASHVIEKKDIVNKNMLLGGMAGGLIGAATALLLAPKSGTDFIKDLTHPFSHEGEHPHQSTLSKTASRKSAVKRKKGDSDSVKASASPQKRVAKTEEIKTHKSPPKKKSPVRHRTAAAAKKRAATAPEKNVSESAET